jgi:hypothetical protein
MPSEEEYRRTEEALDLQEKYLSNQLRKYEQEIAKLRRKRRRRIVQRSLALLSGVLLMMFGFIDLIVVKALDANFNNILIFTLSELIGIPLVRQGIVLFRKMPVEQEITSAVEQLVQSQDSVSQLRDERLKLIRSGIKSTRTVILPPPVAEHLVSFEGPTPQQASGVCPECGENIREGSKICRNCGHLFV